MIAGAVAGRNPPQGQCPRLLPDTDEKAAFKLKFKKTEPFLGALRKMTLNNMVEDPSMIHETLAYDVVSRMPGCRRRARLRLCAGQRRRIRHLPQPREPRQVNLERWFGTFEEPAQHLYEGEDGADVTPGVAALTGKAGGYEVDEGDEAQIGDLEALVAAVNGGAGAGWSASVAPVADLEEMTRMWAVEKYIGHWDGYSGEAGPPQPNNYYLYSDPSGVFQMLPWGTDKTWEPYRRTEFGGEAGLLFDDCLADPACADLYSQALRTAAEDAIKPALDPLAVKTAALLAPWQQLEQGNGRSEHDLAEIGTGVDETRAFIAARPAELTAFLGPEESPAPAGAAPRRRRSTVSGGAGPLRRAFATRVGRARHPRLACGARRDLAGGDDQDSARPPRRLHGRGRGAERGRPRHPLPAFRGNPLSLERPRPRAEAANYLRRGGRRRGNDGPQHSPSARLSLTGSPHRVAAWPRKRTSSS